MGSCVVTVGELFIQDSNNSSDQLWNIAYSAADKNPMCNAQANQNSCYNDSVDRSAATVSGRRGNKHETEHTKFHLNIRKIFCTVRETSTEDSSLEILRNLLDMSLDNLL